MTERVEEIRRRRERLSHVLDDGGNEQALVGSDIDWLLDALAQAEREREELRQDKDAYVLEARLFEQKYDTARAEVERLKGEALVALTDERNCELYAAEVADLKADLARTRAASQEYLAAVEALAFEDSGGLGGNTQEDFDRANRAADALRAALEGRAPVR